MRRAVLLLYGVCLVFGAVAADGTGQSVGGAARAGAVGGFCAFAWLLVWLFAIRSAGSVGGAHLTRRTQKLLARLDVLQAELQAVQSLVALEQVVAEFGDLLRVTLRLDRQTGCSRTGELSDHVVGKTGNCSQCCGESARA